MRFSLQRLMVSLTMLAVGLPIVRYVLKSLEAASTHQLDGGLALLLWLCSGAMIGAGVLCPFRRTKLGASIGLAVQCLLAAFYWFVSGIAMAV